MGLSINRCIDVLGDGIMSVMTQMGGPALTDALIEAEKVRIDVVKTTDESVRQHYSQYLTPKETASFAARMFNKPANGHGRCLDLGSGTGILSVALSAWLGRDIEVDAIELDSDMAAICHKTLSKLNISHRIINKDVLTCHFAPEYDYAILNPPYRKMASNDSRQSFLSIKAPNLYTAFLTCAIEALKPGAECVAIIPRSWTNGDYFAPFRNWLFDRCSIDWMHIYGSRTEVFSDSNVLQETMLLKIHKGPQEAFIKVTESMGKFDEVISRDCLASDLIVGPPNKRIVSMRPLNNCPLSSLSSLKERGLIASTGKVVDFRSREKLFDTNEDDCVPLVYSCNFSKNGFSHPISAGKKQWYKVESVKDEKLLIGPGSFVVVKRFSSKEEARRIKAFAFSPTEPVALENHQNFIHAGTSRRVVPLEAGIARGLDIWLNSTLVDDWFRSISGSTQVNASDLNQMPTPSLDVLEFLGKQWRSGEGQESIDRICGGVIDG